MNLNEMKIYIIAINLEDYIIFKNAFILHKNVKVVNLDLISFMNEYPHVECIVSPANSYGKLTGGYDGAISDYFGWDYQLNVQEYIKKHFYGEQVVGTSFILDAPMGKKLIHTPTMIEPEIIIDDRIIYHCMRSTLICALENNVKSIVIPPFGAGTGMVPIIRVVNLMHKAYKQILNNSK